MAIQVECKRCGKSFEVLPYRLKKGHGQFCSVTCARSARADVFNAARVQRKLEKITVHCSPDGHGKLVRTGIGHEVLVDEDDLDLATTKNWQITLGYARWSEPTGDRRQRVVRMHRVILERKLGRQLQKGELVDHVNRNSADNRRVNLRLASAAQNALNRRHFGKVPYRGVSVSGQKFVAAIRLDNKTFQIGRYETPEEAGWMADQWALEVYGPEFANLNFHYL